MENMIIQKPLGFCQEAYNEPHQPVIFGLDVSGSMVEEPIRLLNKALADFIEHTKLDELAQQRVDIAIVTFGGNSEVKVVQGFKPLSQMEPITLIANGDTPMDKCIDKSVDMFKELFYEYNKIGIPSYKGMFLLITDGMPSYDITKALEKLKYEEGKRRINTIPIGVGKYDKDTLLRISSNAIALSDMDFSKLFRWVDQSFVRISSSKVGEKILLPELPNNARMLALEC